MAKKIPIAVLLILCGLLELQHAQAQSTVGESSPIDELNEEAISKGWLRLFDGESLFGWRAASAVDWEVADGAIVATAGKQGLLRTTSQFDDYQLCLQYRCPSETNSGIFLRTPPNPRNPANDCYEFNIAPASNPFPTGSLVAREKTALPTPADDGEWRQVNMVVSGNTITAWIDGEKAIHLVDDSYLGKGFIGLQYNQGKIEFRKIFLRPLNLEPMIDVELSQWKSDQAMESEFSVDETLELNVVGGQGQLESKSSFADFTFSMQCRTNAVGLNSGVFFRCIPGEFMNGYESQIQNEFVDDDRSRPKDCGTGGIFRRVDAKQVVANDREWFSKTIIASGPHVSVWVNGQQVTDWVDKRKPNTNPRRGLRLDAGTFILQGHDPTTDIDFRNISVKEQTIRWSKDR
jgi:hypothetical protein